MDAPGAHGRPGAATPQALAREPLDRRGSVKEAMGLVGDEDGAGRAVGAGLRDGEGGVGWVLGSIKFF